MKRKIFILILFIFGSLFINNLNAQDIDPGCDILDPACPIDGGVTLLLAAGIGIGVRRAMNRK